MDVQFKCTTGVIDFIKKLDSINNKFILVSGDCDLEVSNYSLIKYENLINSPKLIKWCVQNCTANHPKLLKIPIGLDYHSIQDLSKYEDPVNHENELIKIKNKSKPFHERELKLYSNFHFIIHDAYDNDRKKALELIPKELIYFEEKRNERFKSYITIW